MQNESNSLLELPLESGEILEEVNLNTGHVVTVADNSVDNVGGMLIDEHAASGLPCMEPNSIDFGFVNTDLGNNADFSMDNSGVFGMTDNDIDVREDCEYLFRDSACFDDSNTCIGKQIDTGTLQQAGMVSVAGQGKINFYKDLGLKLQVIPLNNLQYVSTIQTSKGLHILAIPAQTALPNEVAIQQLGDKSKLACSEFSMNQSCECRIQPKLKEVPNLTVESTETIKTMGKTSTKNKLTKKGSLVSRSTRKLRNSMDRKLIICRNNSLKKGYVHRILDNGGLLKRKKVKEVCRVVTKTDISRKRKMVSLLNTSVTNKLQQMQNTASRNNKEIKVTFHLKPSNIVGKTDKERNMVDNFKNVTAEDITSLKTKEPYCSYTKEEFETDKPHNHHAAFEVVNSAPDDGKTPLLGETGHASFEVVDSAPDGGKTMLPSETGHASFEVVNSEPDGGKTVLSGEIGHIMPLEISNKTLEIDTTGNKANRKEYMCKMCLSTFSRQGHFKNHMKTHTEISSEQKNITENFADIGSKVKDSLKYPENHDLPAKEKLYSNVDRQVEEDVTLTSSYVSFHENAQNDSRLPKCEFCGMEFKTQGNLTRHKLTHSVSIDTKIRGRYHCDDCDKSFMQKCDLKRHVASHSGTLPHTCNVCQKGFIRRSDLTVHKKFHTQEKQYRCTLCSKAYFQTGDLSRHMRQNHSDLCEFSCQDCGKKYTTQKTLNLHKKTKH